MNKKKAEFDKIDVQYSENIIINIKPVTETLIKEELPGYVNETYSNTFNSSELCWNCCHSFNCCGKGIPLKYTNNISYIIRRNAKSKITAGKYDEVQRGGHRVGSYFGQ